MLLENSQLVPSVDVRTAELESSQLVPSVDVRTAELENSQLVPCVDVRTAKLAGAVLRLFVAHLTEGSERLVECARA
jgi:hypothetical protein